MRTPLPRQRVASIPSMDVVAVVGKMRAIHWKVRSVKPILRRACLVRVEVNVILRGPWR